MISYISRFGGLAGCCALWQPVATFGIEVQPLEKPLLNSGWLLLGLLGLLCLLEGGLAGLPGLLGLLEGGWNNVV